MYNTTTIFFFIKLNYIQGFNIVKRQKFLLETIGTRPEEDDSYNNVIILNVVLLLGVVLCSLMEMVFYFLYSLKV